MFPAFLWLGRVHRLYLALYKTLPCYSTSEQHVQCVLPAAGPATHPHATTELTVTFDSNCSGSKAQAAVPQHSRGGTQPSGVAALLLPARLWRWRHRSRVPGRLERCHCCAISRAGLRHQTAAKRQRTVIVKNLLSHVMRLHSSAYPLAVLPSYKISLGHSNAAMATRSPGPACISHCVLSTG